MANTVWKGQLTFGLVSFPVRLTRAARKERIPLHYVRRIEPEHYDDREEDGKHQSARFQSSRRAESLEDSHDVAPEMSADSVIAPVRQTYVGEEGHYIAPQELERGYEAYPGRFAVIQREELRRLRQPTSESMEILRSVRMDEIDPVFLETSYYVSPGNGGEHSYGLFYLALKETGYAALAEVAMHGRQHVIVLRPGAKGLVAHTMYYSNEMRAADEHPTEVKDVAPKEIDLAKRFIEAIAAPFQPEEFVDRYREQLRSLIASKETARTRETEGKVVPAASKVVDIMEALRKSLEKVKPEKADRKPVTPAAPPGRTRKRRA